MLISKEVEATIAKLFGLMYTSLAELCVCICAKKRTSHLSR